MPFLYMHDSLTMMLHKQIKANPPEDKHACTKQQDYGLWFCWLHKLMIYIVANLDNNTPATF